MICPLHQKSKGSKFTADQRGVTSGLEVPAQSWYQIESFRIFVFAMSFLHYITFKLVVIRDKRIGSIYYTLAAVIVLYTLAEIFLKKGYLEVRIVLNRNSTKYMYHSRILLPFISSFYKEEKRREFWFCKVLNCASHFPLTFYYPKAKPYFIIPLSSSS